MHIKETCPHHSGLISETSSCSTSHTLTFLAILLLSFLLLLNLFHVFLEEPSHKFAHLLHTTHIECFVKIKIFSKLEFNVSKADSAQLVECLFCI
jgi:hypothetical protein